MIRFIRAADEELRQAVDYYNAQKSGLGDEFLDEVSVGLARIDAMPEAWQAFSRSTRRFLLHRFPYALLYVIRTDEILVVAVAHLHRKPEYWADRTEP